MFVDGDVRIVDGTDSCGRLEVFAFDAWQPVCSDGFDNTDATVACVHMGFGYVKRTQTYYVFVRATITMTKRGTVIK